MIKEKRIDKEEKEQYTIKGFTVLELVILFFSGGLLVGLILGGVLSTL